MTWLPSQAPSWELKWEEGDPFLHFVLSRQEAVLWRETQGIYEYTWTAEVPLTL